MCSKPTELWAESMSFRRTIGPACQSNDRCGNKRMVGSVENAPKIYKPGTEAPDRF